MSYDTWTLPGPARDAESTDGSDQWPVVLFLLATAVLVDQVTKWWGGRTFEAIINTGGSRFVGSAVGAWYSDPITGPLLDLLDLGVVSAALYILARRRRPSSVLAAGAVMIGGWGSNLLDRLGMHNVTAPGAARGAVDFLHIGQHYYNVADLFIAGRRRCSTHCGLRRLAHNAHAGAPSSGHVPAAAANGEDLRSRRGGLLPGDRRGRRSELSTQCEFARMPAPPTVDAS